MPPKIDIEEVTRLIKKELEPINEKLASLKEKYNTLSQTGDFASAKLSTIKYWNSWTININNKDKFTYNRDKNMFLACMLYYKAL